MQSLLRSLAASHTALRGQGSPPPSLNPPLFHVSQPPWSPLSNAPAPCSQSMNAGQVPPRIIVSTSPTAPAPARLRALPRPSVTMCTYHVGGLYLTKLGEGGWGVGQSCQLGWGALLGFRRGSVSIATMQPCHLPCHRRAHAARPFLRLYRSMNPYHLLPTPRYVTKLLHAGMGEACLKAE